MATALLTACKKDEEFAWFARGLRDNHWDILASEGTARFLNEQAGVSAKNVAALVGPPMLGHRVVTLARGIHAALLARADDEEDMMELKRLGIAPIGLVYAGFYPLGEELKKPGRTFASVVGNIDSGGPAMLRSGAKDGSYVVSSPGQFTRVPAFLNHVPSNHAMCQRFKAQLAAEAERAVVAYCLESARFYQLVSDGIFPATT